MRILKYIFLSILALIAAAFLVYSQLDIETKMRLFIPIAKYQHAAEIESNTSFEISFDRHSSIIEGDESLLYSPGTPSNNEKYKQLLSSPLAEFVENTETSIKVEGYGMNGYLHFIQLEPDWYHVILYAPT